MTAALVILSIIVVALLFALVRQAGKTATAEISAKAAVKAYEVEHAARTDEVGRQKSLIDLYKKRLAEEEDAIVNSEDPATRRARFRALGQLSFAPSEKTKRKVEL